MKKKLLIIMTIAALVVCSLCFTACGDDKNSAEYYLSDMLLEMHADGDITLVYSDSATMGMYITSITRGDVTLVNEGSTYVVFYIDTNEDVSLLSLEVDPVEYEGVTYYSAGKGASTMPMTGGRKVLFTTLTYSGDFSSTVGSEFILLECDR